MLNTYGTAHRWRADVWSFPESSGSRPLVTSKQELQAHFEMSVKMGGPIKMYRHLYPMCDVHPRGGGRGACILVLHHLVVGGVGGGQDGCQTREKVWHRSAVLC